MMLFTQRYGTADEHPPLLILHGLFGSSSNWHAQARALENNRRVYLIDLRNHGKSFHHETHTYEAMVVDVRRLMEADGLRQAHLLGHSMGGKVAMHLALRHPEKVCKLIVVDIAPKAYDFTQQRSIAAALTRLPIARLQSRKEADDALARDIKEPGLRQFLLKNLQRTQQGFRWTINLPALVNHLPELAAAVTDGRTCDVPVCFLRGERSNYIRPEDVAYIRRVFPRAVVRNIPQAGHWVHAEQPTPFLEAVTHFLCER